MKVLFSAEINTDEINQNYFCTDQTNMNQTNTTRNFYDSSNINLYATETDIVIGNCLYSSVNCQRSIDYLNIIQNIWILFEVDYEGSVGSFVTNYAVMNSEYISTPNISNILSTSGIFSTFLKYNVYITLSENNPLRILFIIYSD
jgi:hypothetical protein